MHREKREEKRCEGKREREREREMIKHTTMWSLRSLTNTKLQKETVDSGSPLKVCEKICNLFSHTHWLFASGGLQIRKPTVTEAAADLFPTLNLVRPIGFCYWRRSEFSLEKSVFLLFYLEVGTFALAQWTRKTRVQDYLQWFLSLFGDE